MDNCARGVKQWPFLKIRKILVIQPMIFSEPKTWYSISPDDGKRFENFAASLFAEQSSRLVFLL